MVPDPILSETVQPTVECADDEPACRDGRRRGDGVAGVELCLAGARLRVEDVELAVARSDVDAAVGNRWRRINARPRHEAPRRLAGLRIEGMNGLVAPADEHAA